MEACNGIVDSGRRLCARWVRGLPAAGGGAQELLERVLFRLVARRGGMPFLPELGSLLHTLGREKPSERRGVAMQYVTQALAQEPGLRVEQVELTDRKDGRLDLKVFLEWQGEHLTVNAAVG